MKSSLRNRPSDLKVIIIVKTSMVSNHSLFYFHLRLNEIFELVNCEPFSGVSCNFFQLPPVGGKLVYATYTNTLQNFDVHWKLFKIFELTEVMRQRRDSELIDRLKCYKSKGNW